MKIKMRTIQDIIYAVILGFIIMLLLFPCCVMAQNKTSLTVQYELADVRFSFYKVADFSETDNFTLENTFVSYADEVTALKEINKLDTAQWRVLATTLEAVVYRDDLSPMHQDVTDESGAIAVNDIGKGLYLIVGEQAEDESYLYTPSPLLVSIPSKDVQGNWEYDVVIEHNKVEKEEIVDWVSRKVVKIWKDDGKESKRPKEIVVQLLRDGTVYEEVVLSADNNWKHEWPRLDADHKWTAVEKEVPEGYKMISEEDTDTFIITNTYDEPDKPDKELPQTGQLWWPVAVLSVAGAVFIMIGLTKRKHYDI